MTTVSNLMSRHLKTISHDAGISEAAEEMRQSKVSSLLIEREGNVVGIVTDTDIVRKSVAGQVTMEKKEIGLLMSNPVVSLEQDRSPEDAFDLMGEVGTRHLAVTDRGKIVGVLSVRDLLLYFKKQSEPRMGID